MNERDQDTDEKCKHDNAQLLDAWFDQTEGICVEVRCPACGEVCLSGCTIESWEREG